MKNLKKLLFAANLLLIASFVNAQYLVSATEIENRTVSEVQSILEDAGYNTTQMDINAVISYKITYNTIDVFGEPTIASGALFVPQDLCDTLPIVTWGNGTQFDKTWVPSNNKAVDKGLVFSGNGYIAVLPDYLGMGVNSGIHPYVHWESEATASLDLVRASREFLMDSFQIWDNNQLFITGYSQGGHTAMATHKYIKVNDLQSEFNVVASAPMSGPYAMSWVEIDGILNEDSTYNWMQFLPYTFASYQLVYGNLYDNYNEYYDPPYDSLIPAWIAAGTNWGVVPINYYDLMQDTVIYNYKNNPNHPINFDLRKNDLHNWIPEEPVRMLYCGMDPIVFPENSIMAEDTMNALGASDVHAIEIDPTGDHFTCIVPAHTYALEWFDSLRLECEMVNPSTSISTLKEQPEISLYPNPVKDIANFSSEEITSFEIYDMMGALIIKRNSDKVDMTNMNPGIYFVVGFNKANHTLYKGKIIKNN